MTTQSVSYFQSEEVNRAARMEVLLQKIKEQLDFNRDNSPWNDCNDVLLELTSCEESGLCIEKKCPFVNACIRNITFAVFHEFKCGGEVTPELCSEVIQRLQDGNRLVY